MNLSHPAAQRLLALALALEARAQSMIEPPNPVPGYRRLLESVALEHSSTGADLRRIAETIGEPAPAPQALPQVFSAAFEHMRYVASEHAHMLELLQDVQRLLRWMPGDREALAEEYGIDATDDTLQFATRLAVLAEIDALVAEVAPPDPAAGQAVMDFADQPYFPSEAAA